MNVLDFIKINVIVLSELYAIKYIAKYDHA